MVTQIIRVPGKQVPDQKKVRPWIPSAAPLVVDYLPWARKRVVFEPIPDEPGVTRRAAPWIPSASPPVVDKIPWKRKKFAVEPTPVEPVQPLHLNPQLWIPVTPPVPPPVFSVTRNAGRIPRVPESQGRLKPFTEKVSTMLNSLVGGGYIRQGVPATNFSIMSGAIVANHAPSATDDDTVAISPGNIWINSLTGDVYINVSSATGAAVWLGPLS